MGAKDLTTEDALAELTAYLADPPPPEGMFSMTQILEQAKAAGLFLTTNILDGRLRKGMDDGTIIREKYGRTYYYRKVKE